MNDLQSMMNRRIFASLAFVSLACFSANAAPDPAQMKLGKATYATCMACHGVDGKGLDVGPNKMAPTLVDSPLVSGDPDVLALIILKGIVKDAGNFVGIMAPLESALDDNRLAAVMTYVRNSFGNSASPVTEPQAKAARKKYEKLKGSVKRSTIDALLAKAKEKKGHEPGLAASIAAGTAKPAPGPVSTQASDPAAREATYNVYFVGGLLNEFAAYLKVDLQVSANIIVPTSARQASLPDLDLKNVTLPDIFEIVHLATKEEPDHIVFEEVGGGWVASVQKTTSAAAVNVRSYGLAGIQSDEQLKDVFALISEAFTLQGIAGPRLRFHSETKTLLAVVTNEQADVLQGLIAQVMETMKPGALTAELLARKSGYLDNKLAKETHRYQALSEELEARGATGENPSDILLLQKEMLRENLLQLNRQIGELESQRLTLDLQEQ